MSDVELAELEVGGGVFDEHENAAMSVQRTRDATGTTCLPPSAKEDKIPVGPSKKMRPFKVEVTWAATDTAGSVVRVVNACVKALYEPKMAVLDVMLTADTRSKLFTKVISP